MQIAWHPETKTKRWENDELGQNVQQIGLADEIFVCFQAGVLEGHGIQVFLPDREAFKPFQSTLCSLFGHSLLLSSRFFIFLHLSDLFREYLQGFGHLDVLRFAFFFVNIWTEEPNRHIDTTAQTRRSPKLSLNPNLLRFCQSQTNLINFDTNIADIDTNWYQLCQNYWYMSILILLLLLLHAIAAIDTANWIWRNCVRNHSRPWWMECVVPLLPWSSSQGPVQCGIWMLNDAKKWHINSYHASYHASSYGMQCSSVAFGGGYGGHS